MKDECQICGKEPKESDKDSLVLHQGMTKCEMCKNEYESGLQEVGAKNDEEKQTSVRPGTQDWKDEITA